MALYPGDAASMTCETPLTFVPVCSLLDYTPLGYMDPADEAAVGTFGSSPTEQLCSTVEPRFGTARHRETKR